MKDLAYLNAGAARQQLSLLDAVPNDEDKNGDGIIDASVAHDVDADFNKIDQDLSILDATGARLCIPVMIVPGLETLV